MHDSLRFHVTSSGDRLAYHRLEGCSPGVIFLGGFRSDMTGQKAMALEAFCRERGQAFLRFDYYAHGRSEGDFLQGSISRWKENALSMLDHLTQGPQVIVGSSMGGWIMLHLALARPKRLQALIGIAAAPDFTEALMWPAMSAQQQDEVMQAGVTYIPSAYGDPYPITRLLIEDGRRECLLHHDRLAVRCPVRLLQGMRDADVPWRHAFAIAGRLESRDMQVTLLKDGDHRLSEPDQLRLLAATVEQLSRG